VFTDNYIELVKDRAKSGGAAAASAVGALNLGLSVLLRLFAPVLPFITEEVWSWKLRDETGVPSIHRAAWPSVHDVESREGLMDLTIAAITAVRKFKAEAKVSVMAALDELEFIVHPSGEGAIRSVLGDLAASSRVMEARVAVDDSLRPTEVQVKAKLSPPNATV
jgi:valyl-tRNA synthetase